VLVTTVVAADGLIALSESASSEIASACVALCPRTPTLSDAAPAPLPSYTSTPETSRRLAAARLTSASPSATAPLCDGLASSVSSVYDALKRTCCRTAGAPQPSVYSVVAALPHDGCSAAPTPSEPKRTRYTVAVAFATHAPSVNVAVIVARVQPPPSTAQ